MPDAVCRMLTLLCALVVTCLIGTNLGLLHLRWILSGDRRKLMGYAYNAPCHDERALDRLVERADSYHAQNPRIAGTACLNRQCSRSLATRTGTGRSSARHDGKGGI